MTDQINDQISAFLDDQLSDEESTFLVRRFERDPEARNQAKRYTLIGCALRGELLQPDPLALQRRIAAALDGAPKAATQSQSARTVAAKAALPRFFRPVASFAIAATVALASIVVLRSVNDDTPNAVPTAAVASQPVAVQARQWTEPASYVVPQDVPNAPGVASPIRLTNYLVRHGEYASGLSRTSVHSNVVGAAEVIPPSEEQPTLE